MRLFVPLNLYSFTIHCLIQPIFLKLTVSNMLKRIIPKYECIPKKQRFNLIYHFIYHFIFSDFFREKDSVSSKSEENSGEAKSASPPTSPPSKRPSITGQSSKRPSVNSNQIAPPTPSATQNGTINDNVVLENKTTQTSSATPRETLRENTRNVSAKSGKDMIGTLSYNQQISVEQ